MSLFFVSLIAVGVLLVAATPGFIMQKCRVVSEECIPGFSKVLLFVCQPCLAIYSFSGVELDGEMLASLGVFALLCLAVFAVMLGGAYLVLYKKCEKPIFRILTIATTFSNCAFFGIPIIEAVMPDRAAGVIVYTTVFAVVMNVVGWTIGSAIIARNVKYMSLKKIIFNPAMIGLVVSLVIALLKIPIHPDLFAMITSLAKMCTPLSMIIMGMRLATMRLGALFVDLRIYLTVAVKQFIMPLVGFLMVLFLPIASDVKAVFFIMCACPAASIVLNFAEIVGEGQREAANTVLLSTILSIVTLPIMMLLLPIIL
jgi:predicted permease